MNAALSTGRRWLRFNAVGAIGIGVQMAVLAALVAAGTHYLAATVAAVEAAVLHNYAWHRRWTWADRNATGLAPLLRFHAANGAVSLAGNIAFMWLLAGLAGLHPVFANALSIAACALLNFFLADRLVFAQS